MIIMVIQLTGLFQKRVVSTNNTKVLIQVLCHTPMQLSTIQHRDTVNVNHNKQNYIWDVDVF